MPILARITAENIKIGAFFGNDNEWLDNEGRFFFREKREKPTFWLHPPSCLFG
jgi:hypothetical protein